GDRKFYGIPKWIFRILLDGDLMVRFPNFGRDRVGTIYQRGQTFVLCAVPQVLGKLRPALVHVHITTGISALGPKDIVHFPVKRQGKREDTSLDLDLIGYLEILLFIVIVRG